MTVLATLYFAFCIETVWILVWPLLSWTLTVSDHLCVISYFKEMKERDRERSRKRKRGKRREAREGKMAEKIQGTHLPLCTFCCDSYSILTTDPQISQMPNPSPSYLTYQESGCRPVIHPLSLQVITLTPETGNTQEGARLLRFNFSPGQSRDKRQATL